MRVKIRKKPAKSSLPEKSSQIKFHIQTLGCPKNRVDSRRMRSALLSSGFKESNTPENADILLVNSCSFIKEAQEETIETIFTALKLKNQKKQAVKKVGMVGCFSERFPTEVKAEIPELDFLLGTGKFHLVPHLLAEQFQVQLVPHEAESEWRYSPTAEKITPWAYFRIAQGCNRSCAFCIIPVIRGKLMPYSQADLERQFQEEKALRGGNPIREVILVSQDTISQGVDELDRIIDFFSGKEEVRWIRLQYLFPDRRVLKLLDLFKKYDKLTSYLDIPFQHTSPEILNKMKRPSDVGLFKEIIRKAHEIRPNIELRTSFIVGFPGETEKDAGYLTEFLQKNPVDKLALFRYSHEKGTWAGNTMDDTVPDEIKIERINRIRDQFLSIRNERRNTLIDSPAILMIDEIQSKEIIARREQDSPEIDEAVYLQKPAKFTLVPGDFLQAVLRTPMEYDWMGEIASITPQFGKN